MSPIISESFIGQFSPKMSLSFIFSRPLLAFNRCSLTFSVSPFQCFTNNDELMIEAFKVTQAHPYSNSNKELICAQNVLSSVILPS